MKAIETRRLQRRSLRRWREVNRHKLDICVLRLRQGRIQEFSYVGQIFLVLKWKGVLISKYGIEIEHIKQK